MVLEYLVWFRGPQDFKRGQLLDCEDFRANWYHGEVKCVSDGKLLIHYTGWSDKWNTWIAVDSDSIAPLNWKTTLALLSSPSSLETRDLVPKWLALRWRNVSSVFILASDRPWAHTDEAEEHEQCAESTAVPCWPQLRTRPSTRH
jgi:hypothetical protein